ncbi:MAG: family transposase [Betaproteobacteria bacterium]|nr:family transposase [Betaproteobacteria bacterium]
MDRKGIARTQQQRMVNQLRHSGSAAFVEVLAGPQLGDTLQSLMRGHRRRIFTPVETLSMFMAQALSADRGCQNAVNAAALRRLGAGQPACSTRTGGYCQARERLVTNMVSTLARRAGQAVSGHTSAAGHWQAHRVRLVDGTTLRMPDTAANQAAFAQPTSQQAGLGFPICRLVVLTCLGSGALLDAAIGPYQGKGADEHTLLRSMLHTLEPGEVLIGDALYATYFLLCALQARGIEGLFEQHGARRRSIDFRRGQRLGTRDHLIVLAKPRRPEWMSIDEYERAPEQLTVRELCAGGRTLLTTLRCPKQASKSELAALYGCRWHVELDLRNIKSTLGMDMLSCQSAPMVIKEIWVYLLAYNVIRLLMAKAAVPAKILPRQLSFKHTLQLFTASISQACALWRGPHLDLLVLIAQRRVGERPGRIEPRAIKRRPPAYPLLTKSRAVLKTELLSRRARAALN